MPLVGQPYHKTFHHHHHHHHHNVKDNHSKYLQTENCAEECQVNQIKPREIKDNSYKRSKKPTVKARSIGTFLFTNLGSRPGSAHGKILSNCHYTERGAFN